MIYIYLYYLTAPNRCLINIALSWVKCEEDFWPKGMRTKMKEQKVKEYHCFGYKYGLRTCSEKSRKFSHRKPGYTKKKPYFFPAGGVGLIPDLEVRSGTQPCAVKKFKKKSITITM